MSEISEPTKAEQIASKIRLLSDKVAYPEKFRVVIPEPVFDHVLEELDVDSDEIGSKHYEDISLCWSQYEDTAKLRYRNDLDVVIALNTGEL